MNANDLSLTPRFAAEAEYLDNDPILDLVVDLMLAEMDLDTLPRIDAIDAAA